MVVETGMEGRISISVQSEPIVAPIAITLSFDFTTLDPKIDVRVEEIEATYMEE
jgi:hypothetical protein